MAATIWPSVSRTNGRRAKSGCIYCRPFQPKSTKMHLAFGENWQTKAKRHQLTWKSAKCSRCAGFQRGSPLISVPSTAAIDTEVLP